MGFSIYNKCTQDITQVPNIFIDCYMPDANGSFVKVYLYLLRQFAAGSGSSAGDGSFAGSSPSGNSGLSIETMADTLSNTEADILRALRYWEKQNIISLTEESGKITSICLLPLTDTGRHTENRPPAAHAAKPKVYEIEIPDRHFYTPLQAEALKKDTEIESCLSVVEALLGTTISDAHMQLILYLMSDLGFSMELVITLYETALARGKDRPRYIEAIALDWAKKGIRDSKAAEEEASAFNGMYKLVSGALGIRRPLAPAEKSIIDKWEAFHFSPEIIEEACNRTVLQSGDTNLNYTSRILEEWHKKGVTCRRDIEECDHSYFRQHNHAGTKVTSIHKNKFQNFPQRNYTKNEYNDLEKQLLQQ